MNSLKEAFRMQNLLKNLNFFGELNLGLILTAVGIVYFKNPNHFAFGGTSGLSILLADLFPKINVGGFMWIINLVLVVLGFVFLGVKCMGWTIYSSFALSFFVSVCEWLYPSGMSMSGDAMLDLVFAVFLPALGAAIVFDIGASTGGTDIVALILAKYTSMEIGKALMASDILIVLAAAWRFGMGTGLYCILGLIGKSFVVDGAIENIRLRKVCTIMTSNPQPILDFIIKEMNRSATVEKAYGAYTHHELSVLVTVLTRRQALQLRNFLRENDPHSFITIVNSSEIIRREPKPGVFYAVLCRPHGGAYRPGLASGPAEVVRAGRHRSPLLRALPLPAGEPGAHQKEDGGACPRRKPRCAGDPAAAGQGRRAGCLDDR